MRNVKWFKGLIVCKVPKVPEVPEVAEATY